MIEVTGFGHINIIVDSLDDATEYYQTLLGAIPVQYFSEFRNQGFAKSAGFLKDPQAVNVSIGFMKIPSTDIYLELMCYHHPVGNKEIKTFLPNDLGGPRHICLRVKNIENAFNKIKAFDQVTLLDSSLDYKPYKLDQVFPEQFKFIDKKLENNLSLKEQSANISSQISFFYFYDKYGVLWELEEAPEHLDDPVLA